jgi:hypothetical protein
MTGLNTRSVTMSAFSMPPGSSIMTATGGRCKYWWDKTQKGENWFGTGPYVKLDHALVDELMMADPDAFQLLMYLRRHHWGRDFSLVKTAELLPLSGTRRERFAQARQRLIEYGYLIVVRPPRFNPSRPMV